MVLLLLLLLVVLPVAELVLIVRVAGEIGVLDTLALLALVSIVGVWLAKRAGLGVVARIRQAQAEGRVPEREVADGALVLLGGLLLLLPGFISDIMGIALLLPPTRAGIRTLALRRLANRGRVVVVGRRDRADGQADGDIWDVESWEETPPDGRRGQIGEGP
ncbi:MAG: FxsA family protein [Acidimicrobiales bacterium]